MPAVMVWDNPPKSSKKSEFGGLFGRFIKRICISKLLYLNEKQLRIILVEVVWKHDEKQTLFCRNFAVMAWTKKTPMEVSSMGVFGKLVGARGFEPPASASRTQRSSQTEPHPDKTMHRALLRGTSYNIAAFSLKSSPISICFQRDPHFLQRTFQIGAALISYRPKLKSKR